jgi:hypothetical protein
MIKTIVSNMIKAVQDLQYNLILDIEDVKQANHEQLLDRNDIKLVKMEDIASLKKQLNIALSDAIKNGIDVNIFREDVNNLEDELLNLSKLNTKLASIVLPVKEMYKDMINDIQKANGGSVIEVRA